MRVIVRREYLSAFQLMPRKLHFPFWNKSVTIADPKAVLSICTCIAIIGVQLILPETYGDE